VGGTTDVPIITFVGTNADASYLTNRMLFLLGERVIRHPNWYETLGIRLINLNAKTINNLVTKVLLRKSFGWNDISDISTLLHDLRLSNFAMPFVDSYLDSMGLSLFDKSLWLQDFAPVANE
jgi:hypothetical protein